MSPIELLAFDTAVLTIPTAKELFVCKVDVLRLVVRVRTFVPNDNIAGLPFSVTTPVLLS